MKSLLTFTLISVLTAQLFAQSSQLGDPETRRVQRDFALAFVDSSKVDELKKALANPPKSYEQISRIAEFSPESFLLGKWKKYDVIFKFREYRGFDRNQDEKLLASTYSLSEVKTWLNSIAQSLFYHPDAAEKKQVYLETSRLSWRPGADQLPAQGLKIYARWAKINPTKLQELRIFLSQPISQTELKSYIDEQIRNDSFWLISLENEFYLIQRCEYIGSPQNTNALQNFVQLPANLEWQKQLASFLESPWENLVELP